MKYFATIKNNKINEISMIGRGASLNSKWNVLMHEDRNIFINILKAAGFTEEEINEKMPDEPNDVEDADYEEIIG